MFKKTQISNNIMKALPFITFSVLLGGGITNPVSAETITLENQQISRTRGEGDRSRYATEFNHPDQDLVIHWQNNDSLPADGNPIRDGNVNVRNLTIDANFFEDINDSDPNPRNHYYLEIRNKGVYANSGLTHIHASDTIQIKAKNDGIYTESDGSVLIDGFKKLDVQGTGYASMDVFALMDPNFPREEFPRFYTTGAHGIVDNGEGISIHGGSGSEINIVSNGFAVMNGIGNRLGVYSTDPRGIENSAVGRGIDITTDKLTVESRGNAIGAATGKGGRQFKVSVESADVKLKGAFASVLAGGNALIEINQHTQGLVQLTGKVAAGNQGQVHINFDKDGSYLDDGRPSDRSDEIIVVGGLREREHDNADIGHAVLNFRGNDQYIKGYSRIQGERALLELTSTGANFSAKTQTGGTYDRPLFFVEQGGTLKLNASGENATFVGELKAQEASLLDMTVSGQGAHLQGNITTSEATPGAHIKALFSGDNAQLEGKIITLAQESTIELTLRGANSSLKGNVTSFGSSGSSSTQGYFSHSGNVVRLESTGAGMKFEGELQADRENTLTANFSGEGAELNAGSNGKLISNSGTLSLTVSNHGTLTGNMDNFAKRIQRGRQGRPGYEDYMVKGNLAVTLANATSYSGDVTNQAGTVGLTLKESEWFGNLTTASEAEDTHVALEKSLWRGDMTAAPEAQRTSLTLTRESTWKGVATGSGMVELSEHSTWKATANSQLDTLTMDATSVTSLEGDAQRLTTQTLNGSGTFVLDLTYQDNAIETYRDGTASDFIEVTQAGDSGTHRVALTETTNLETMPVNGKLYFAVAPEGQVTFESATQVLEPNPQRLFHKLKHYQILSEAAQTSTPDAESSETSSDSARRVARDVAPAMQNWYLTYTGSEEVVNKNALTAPDIYTSTVALWRDNDTLLKRLGDLHALRAGTGSWARLIARKLDRSGEHAFESKLNTVQIGIDRSRLDERGTWYFGLAYAYHDGKSTVNTGSSDVDGHELTLYASRADNERRHLDLVARLGRFGTHYDSLSGDKGSFHNLAASVSAEVGWVLPLGAAWQIEPQAQLTYSTVWGDTFNTHYGIKVEQDNAKSLVGRLGVVLAREFTPSAENAGRVYAKASVLHDFLGKTRSTLTDGASYIVEDTLRDTWGVLGIGTTWRHGEHLHLYLDAETSVGASVRMNYNLNAGLRYTF